MFAAGLDLVIRFYKFRTIKEHRRRHQHSCQWKPQMAIRHKPLFRQSLWAPLILQD